MTDDEFLGYFVAGLEIAGHRVSARIGRLSDLERVASVSSSTGDHFIIRVDHGKEIPIAFAEVESLASRMAKVDAAVERWVLLRP